MLTKADLESLAEMRLEDAKLLFSAGKPSSAYYLSGYAIELGLKVCIAKQMRSDIIPDKSFINDIYTHRLEKLLGLAGLAPSFDKDKTVNPKLAENWIIVVNWDEHSRYEIWDSLSAAAMITAIGDPADGVFQWVKRHW